MPSKSLVGLGVGELVAEKAGDVAARLPPVGDFLRAPGVV